MTRLDKYQLQPLFDRLSGSDPDPEALNELFAQLRPYFHSVVRKTLGESAPQGALDHSNLMQSSLGRVFRKWDEIIAKAPTLSRFLAYVKRMVHNRCLDELNARHPIQLPVLFEARERISSPERRERDQRALRVLESLGELPLRQRQVVEMRWLDGLKDEEIAGRLGGSEVAIRVLRYRALLRLKEIMEKRYDNE